MLTCIVGNIYPADDTCVPVTGRRFVSLCCGDQHVWTVDNRGQVYLRIGVGAPGSSQQLSPAWVPVDGAPITVGARFTKVVTNITDWMVSGVREVNNLYKNIKCK